MGMGWNGPPMGHPMGFGPMGHPMGPMGPMGHPMGPRGPMMGMGMGPRPMMGQRPPMGMGMGAPMRKGKPGPEDGLTPADKQNRMNPKSLIQHQAFDPSLATDHFGRATADLVDEPLTAALVKRTEELTPSEVEAQAVVNLVTKVNAVVEALIAAGKTEESTSGLTKEVDEVRVVGSYKKQTMLAGHPVADLVVIMKETPDGTDIQGLATKVQEKMKEANPGDDFPTQANEGGFNTTSSEGALVRVLVTTLPKNLFSVDLRQVDVKLLEGALATIRHARWFEENASHATVRVLVRVLKDMKKRFAGLAGLTPWLIDLLAFRAATLPGNTRVPLPVNTAFRRSLQLISAGIFLPGSLGIVDPCESGQVRAHSVLSLEEQDQLCLTAQTLLRVLSHGAFNEILGVGGESEIALDTDITSWGGTLVTPGVAAYDKDEHKKESDVLQEGLEAAKEEPAKEVKMETS